MTKITKTTIDRMPPKSIAMDKGTGAIVGFGVRRQHSEARVFFFKYRFEGRTRWISIGRFGQPWTVEQARAEARKLAGKIAEGADPAATRDTARDNPTVADLAKDWLALHVEPKRKPRTHAEYARLLKMNILPKIGTLRAATARHQDIAKLHHGMRATPYAANRCLALLSAMFNWSIPSNYGVTANPCQHVERYAEQGRERFLSEDELARLSSALDCEANPYVAGAVRLLVFTGCRLSEILTLQWQYVDFDRKLLLLPDSKTGAKAVFLNAPALEILSGLPRVEGNPFAIVGAIAGSHLVNLEKAWLRVRDLAELPGVRLHDLRHTHASASAAGGLSLPMIGALLGHKSQATTQKYAHLAGGAVQAAGEATGQRLAASMSGKPSGEVIELSKAKAR